MGGDAGAEMAATYYSVIKYGESFNSTQFRTLVNALIKGYGLN